MQSASSALELIVNQLSADSASGYVSAPKGFLRGAINVLTEESAQLQKRSSEATLAAPEEHCRRGDAFLAAFEFSLATKPD